MSETLDELTEPLDPFTEDVDPGDETDGFVLGDRAEDESTDQQSLALFEGDAGTLHEEQRRCLHALLKNRYIDADRHADLWATLLRDEDLLRSRLNDLFLELYVDRERRVAYKRQARTETGDGLPTLLNDVRHTKEETIALVFLRRRRFAQRQQNLDDVTVERSEILAEIEQLRPPTITNRSAAKGHADQAIVALKKADVLLRTPDPDRFLISPIIEVLLPVERLQMLWDWLLSQNAGGETSEDPVPDEGTPTHTDLMTELEENA